MQVKRISPLWLWIIAGAAFGLLVLAPLLMILMKYHFDKHLFPFKEVTINFYREAGNIDFVSGLVSVNRRYTELFPIPYKNRYKQK